MLKSSRLWQNSPKLVKLAAGVLAALLSKAINNSISKGIIRDEEKISLVSAFDKTTRDIQF